MPSNWKKRIEAANKSYEDWETLFSCKELEKYYEGFQWEDFSNVGSRKPYVVNQFYVTAKVKMANYLFASPKFLISPQPRNSDYDLDFAVRSAQLKEDVVNSLIGDDRARFKDEVRRAFLDSLFRFGVIEVSYAADWIQNPRAGKPVFKSFDDPDYVQNQSKPEKPVREPEELPENERVYFKRIAPSRFRVGGVDAYYLNETNWYGYYEYVYKSDLFASPGIDKKAVKNIDLVVENSTNRHSDADDEIDQNDIGDLTKIWHIWDNRSKERIIVHHDSGEILFRKPITSQGIYDLRWDERTQKDSFYPVPPAFQWYSPQNEINETREQLRSHRQRFTRKFQYKQGSVDPEEVDKFTNGPDGTLIETKADDAIKPIQNPDLGAANQQSFIEAKDDFNVVSGTSAETRGYADRTTATQANIIDKRANAREAYEETLVSDWMCSLGRAALHLAQTEFSLGTLIKITADSPESMFGEVQESALEYVWVTPETLNDGYDFKIVMDIVSMSPVKADEEKKHFLEFLALMNTYPQIALSPVLIREAAYRCGYRNEKVIKEMQNAALVGMMGEATQGDPAKAQRIVAKATPNTQEQITNQIDSQLLQ